MANIYQQMILEWERLTAPHTLPTSSLKRACLQWLRNATRCYFAPLLLIWWGIGQIWHPTK